jgi:hypothetical protein
MLARFACGGAFVKAQLLISLGAAMLFASLASAQDVIPTPANTSPIPFSLRDGTLPSGARTREGILPAWLGLNWDLPTRQDPLFWVGLDYQMVWMQGINLPPLVTTSPVGTPRINAGVLGAPGTNTLFSGQIQDNVRSGVRLGAGYWFDPRQALGIETGFMIFESQSGIFSASSTDGTILARPFRNSNTQTQQAVLVAFPGSSNGTIDIRARSGNFYEAHVDLTEKAYDNDFFRLYSMIGYRFYRYDEGTLINQTISPTDPLFVAGTLINTNDRFNTRNQFHGIDLGFRSEFFWDRLSIDLLTKIAVGRLFRTFDISGDQTITVPGAAPVVQSGGLFALGNNSGVKSNSDWKVMPEFGVTLNYQFRPNCNLRLGYSFILLQSIAHASEQIDQNINTNLLPGGNPALGGSNLPAFRNIRADQWIQTVNFGVEFRY